MVRERSLTLAESRRRRDVRRRLMRRRRYATTSVFAIGLLAVAFSLARESVGGSNAASRPPAPDATARIVAVGNAATGRWLARPAGGDASLFAALTTGRRASGRAVPSAPGRRGELVVVPGGSAVSGTGPTRRFIVEVEGGLRIDRKTFARSVVRTLFDRRSWARSGSFALRRVDSGPVDFRVALASPALTDRLCLPLRTNGVFSCAEGGRAVVNVVRWKQGADSYRGRLRAYRVYVVNHEVGHVLGHTHASCPGSGEPAPVMVQQTKGVAACSANPWPLPAEAAGD